jgi:hypothetical protein
MIIFIRNIPGDAKREEIIEFVKPAMKGGFFRAKGIISDVKIMALKNINNNLIEYHALVIMAPESAALRVIKKLHGQHFKNKRTSVRQYHTRRWQNDKRMGNSHSPAGFKEKRYDITRRRNMEVIEERIVEYNSRRTFSQYLY